MRVGVVLARRGGGRAAVRATGQAGGGAVEALAPEVETPWNATADAMAPRAATPQYKSFRR